MTTDAILNLTEAIEMAPNRSGKESENQGARWQAVLARDNSQDGSFVFAVSSTGVYCRPSCPSRRPRRENVTFFSKPDQAEKAGYRACLRCRPRAIGGNATTEMVKAMCRYIERHLDGRPGQPGSVEYHYPSVIQAKDGAIHVTYSYFVPGGKSIKHVRFNEDWVKAGD